MTNALIQMQTAVGTQTTLERWTADRARTAVEFEVNFWARTPRAAS